uniref:Uncharacterized protein n=1 Tax=Avena sativa TaxID=4498 RepID=A0ACD5Z5B4_AVESA
MGSSTGLRSVIICVLILGLVLEQAQVEAKICCMISAGEACYELCRILGGASERVCKISCGCKDISGKSCSGLYPIRPPAPTPVHQMPSSSAAWDVGHQYVIT